ncbi:MAG: hypothetical protein [Microvirus sp.]|nr:MAG: hypothetical protein [Microvirus sp.]
MKKVTFKSCLNYDYTKELREQNNGESQTVPDQALTIPEVLKRYASGRPLDVAVYDDYQGDAEHLTGVDIRTMDIEEVHELLTITKTNLQKLQDETNIRRKKEYDEKLEESIIAKFKARQEADKPSEQQPSHFIQPKLPL